MTRVVVAGHSWKISSAPSSTPHTAQLLKRFENSAVQLSSYRFLPATKNRLVKLRAINKTYAETDEQPRKGVECMSMGICDAIADRAVVRFSYDGGSRTVEPHCHGVSRAGNEVLRGYQVGGYSESGNPVGWKLFEVAKISGLRQSGEVFTADRPGYNPNDRGMSSIHCHV